MAKKDKRLRYNNGGLHLQKDFGNVNASLNYHQTQDQAKSKVTVRSPKTEASATREKYTGSPSRTKYELKRKLGRSFEASITKEEGDTRYRIQYTRPFGKK
mgnify:CR=1 FL=1|tara:strand:- start:88 stop:390 length:303 start_codon:yes stop_codon:yes gene_type:complete